SNSSYQNNNNFYSFIFMKNINILKRGNVINESNPKINFDGDFCGGWCSRFDLVSITFTYDVSNTTYGERNGCCITWNKVCCGSRLYDRFTKVSDGNKFSTWISRWNDRSFLFGVTLSQVSKS